MFTETELARHYASPEALLSHPEVKKFADWVKNKPNDYLGRAKMINRKR